MNFNVTKEATQLLGSRLEEQSLLPGASFSCHRDKGLIKLCKEVCVFFFVILRVCRIYLTLLMVESPCECGIEPPGSISHGVSYGPRQWILFIDFLKEPQTCIFTQWLWMGQPGQRETVESSRLAQKKILQLWSQNMINVPNVQPSFYIKLGLTKQFTETFPKYGD